MRVGLGIDQLNVDADTMGRPTDAAFKHVAHVQLAANLLRVGGVVPIDESGIA